MIVLTRRFKSLSPPRRTLLVATIAALAVAAIAVALLPFRWTTGRIRHPMASIASRPDRLRWSEDVRWAVTACARRVPWRAKCLERGLAAIWLLRRRGVHATLHYGLARDGTALAAHAWVMAGETEVIGCDNKTDFTEIARFPDDQAKMGPVPAQS